MAVTTTYGFQASYWDDIAGLTIHFSAPGIGPVDFDVMGPDVAGLAGGGIVVCGDNLGHTDITYFGSDREGTIVGTSLNNTGTGGAVAQLSNGNVVVANVVVASAGRAQVFYTITTATGATVVPSTGTGVVNAQFDDVDVAGLTGSGFVIVAQTPLAGNNNIWADVRNSDGSVRTQFFVDTSTANDSQNPSVAALADGGFAVAWHRNVGSESDLYYAVYNSDGSVRKAKALLDPIGTVNRNASVVALDNGGFAIAYEDNGWTPGDIDITLARFDASGNPIDWGDISQNAYDDMLPSATLLSNGMIVVGLIQDFMGAWMLVDQNTGQRLALVERHPLEPPEDYELYQIPTFTSPAVGSMGLGRIGAFYEFNNSGVRGNILQVQRISSGDAADNVILGNELLDVVFGGDGNDVIRGGLNGDHLEGGAGNDTFVVAAGEIGSGFFEYIYGDAGFDTIQALSSVDLTGTTSPFSIEAIQFFDTFGPQMSIAISNILGNTALLVDGRSGVGVSDLLMINMNGGYLDLRSLTFQDFETGWGPGDDRIIVTGTSDTDSITGSSMGDEIDSGGGNDTLNGRVGPDVMRGGTGDDLYYVDNAADVVDEKQVDGIDRVVSSRNFNLGSATQVLGSVEKLTLTGTLNLFGVGNALGNVITGNSGSNALKGGAGNDTMNGVAGTDFLTGGAGADKLTGGLGADTFIFQFASDSTVASAGRDLIVDLSQAQSDKIDLVAIDAQSTVAGDQAFDFIGTAAFSNTAGELRFQVSGANLLVFGDTDGNGLAEFAIQCNSITTLQASDFIL